MKKILLNLIILIISSNLFAMEPAETEKSLYAQLPEQIREYVYVRLSDLEIDPRSSPVENFKTLSSQIEKIYKDIGARSPIIQKLANKKILDLFKDYSEDDFLKLNQFVFETIAKLALYLKPSEKDLKDSYFILREILVPLKKLDPNLKDDTIKRNLLIHAVNANLRNVVSFLLKNQIFNINEGDRLGHTPLIRATMEGYKDIVKLLIDYATNYTSWNINAKDIQGMNALMHAQAHNLTDIADILIKAGAKSTEEDFKKLNQYVLDSVGLKELPAHLPSLIFRMVRMLDTELRDDQGRNMLIKASEQGHKNIVYFLIRKGNDINAKDSFGETALMKAVNNNFVDIAKLLIEAGADVNAADKMGYTPLERTKRGTEMKYLLEKAGAK
ncbi:ankyrin repeat domain-containing protein [Candidatus Dependentiae bacterium]|nr:ankyrin repeat domain-containing protein [Candidatus Dependentiae bacterium]